MSKDLLIGMLREAAALLGLALALSFALGLSRGLPEVGREPDATSCMAPQIDAEGPPPPISPEEAMNQHHSGAMFVDARSTNDYESGHIAGALSVPMETGVLPEGTLSLISASCTVIAYGESDQSMRLAALLSAAGVRDVRVLDGGFSEWVDSDYPAEAGPCLICP